MISTATWLCGPPPANGQYQRYPGRFVYNLRKNYPEFVSDRTLHMFAGSCEFGITTDLREETGAHIVSPFDKIPERWNGYFDNVLADPPYADHWQGQWHGELPKPKHILREAARLVKPAHHCHPGVQGVRRAAGRVASDSERAEQCNAGVQRVPQVRSDGVSGVSIPLPPFSLVKA